MRSASWVLELSADIPEIESVKKLLEKPEDEYCDDGVDTVYRDEQDDEGMYRNSEV